LKVNYPEYFFN